MTALLSALYAPSRSLVDLLPCAVVPVRVACMDASTGWEALADAIIRRRKQLGFDRQKDFASHVGITPRYLNDLENARRDSYGPGTFVDLETALLWGPGSVQAVIGGHPPDELPIPEPPAKTLAQIDDVELVTRFSELHAEMTRRLLTRSRVDPSSLPTVPTGDPVPWDEEDETGQSSA
jgi:transcriptional regulator with XRE-family HTH domain